MISTEPLAVATYAAPVEGCHIETEVFRGGDEVRSKHVRGGTAAAELLGGRELLDKPVVLDPRRDEHLRSKAADRGRSRAGSELAVLDAADRARLRAAGTCTT